MAAAVATFSESMAGSMPIRTRSSHRSSAARKLAHVLLDVLEVESALLQVILTDVVFRALERAS